MKRQFWPHVAVGYLGVCILLGGASAAGAVANAFLQVAAVVLIVALLWTRRATLPPGSSGLALITGLFLALVIISLYPLPPSVWEGLPFRGEIAQGLRMLGIARASLPLSLSPSGTVASALSLLPPVAMFLISVHLSTDHRNRLQITLLVAAVSSIILGAFQLLGGTTSPLRFYEITNPNMPVGFFANVNHQATLLLCAIPFTGVLAGRLATKKSARSKRSGGMIISVATAMFLAIGIILTGSMAGYALFLVAAVASVLIYRRAAFGPLTRRWVSAVGVLAAAFVLISVTGPLSEQRLSGKFSEHRTSRRTIAETTLKAIDKSFPVGTGLGTFADVYRTFEDPRTPSNEYANHAHNDYLEIALELGIIGILLVIGFLIWWIRRSIYAWTNDFSGAPLARAGSVIIGIVLLHSAVDYPIRTTAIASIFALACAFLVPRVSGSSKHAGASRVSDDGVRHLQAD